MLLAPGHRAEISRKVLHLLSAATPVAYLLLDRETILVLLWVGGSLALLVEGCRHASPRFQAAFQRAVGFMVRSAEWQRMTGATYVLFGALLAVWLFPKRVAIGAMLIQSISDSAASLVGLHWGRSRFLGKSLAGSLAFFLTAVAILWVMLPDSKGVGFVAALVATVTEALPSLRLGRFELNDNITVPLVAGGTLWLLSPGGAAT